MKTGVMKQDRTSLSASGKTTSSAPIWLIALSVGIIVVLTAATFWNVFDPAKEFTNWDDNAYVTEQPLVRNLDGPAINKMFDTDTRVAANYHPLTMLSLAVDYQRGNGAISAFMQTTLLLHILNACLVFWLVYTLSGKRLVPAAIVAALFGVHPMHVESVAWVAERKDVLYSAFYLLALIAYVKYLRSSSLAYAGLTFVAFVLSCLSKPMAVTLPVLLLCIDYLERRAWTVRVVVEKLPFFAVSLWFGLLTLDVQASTTVGLVDTTTYSLGERTVFALYGIGEYFVKLLVPSGLSAVYPYPDTIIPGQGIPVNVFASAAVVALSLIATIVWAVRSRSASSRWAAFGVAWFVVTVSIVLQFVSVGAAIIADRYTYVPYIGLWIAMVMLLDRIVSSRQMQTTLLVIAALCVGVYAMKASERVDVWKNSNVLWTNVIEQYPFTFRQDGDGTTVVTQGVQHAYNNRAVYALSKGDLAAAERDYQVLVSVQTKKAYTYKGYGALLQRSGRHAQAIDILSKAIAVGGYDAEVYRARALSLMNLQRFADAATDWRVLAQNNPNDVDARIALCDALIKAKQFEEVLRVSDPWISSGMRNPTLHLMRGMSLGLLERHSDALREFESCVALDPSNEQAKANAAIAKRLVR